MILPSGISLLDRIMNGGLNTGILTHVYGEAAAGKTTFGLQFVKAMCRQGIGTIYINSEATTPVERLEQMTGKPFTDFENLVKIFLPKGFSEQGVLIDDLDLYIRDDMQLIVVDTLTKHYRLALEDKKTNYANHRELNRQTGVLKGLARQRDIAVLVLNQVTAKMKSTSDFEPVAGNILDYWSDYVIKMNIGKSQGERLLRRILPEGDRAEGRLFLTETGFSVERPVEKE
ncbi:MAG: ATPase domain-containing protein [Candidatus Thorarchaeota archaeon]